MPAHRPLCFVLMPFGTKKDPANRPDLDFDDIYQRGIRPGIEAAGLEPVRADAEVMGGIIHKPMFERLLLCDYAVADMTTANANVFYELGVRHAVRPRTTLTLFAQHQPIPFDVNFLRSLPYVLTDDNRLDDAGAEALKDALASRLKRLVAEGQAGDPVDSPLFQLLDGYQAPPLDVARLKTDVFREQVQYAQGQKAELEQARRRGDTAALQRLGDTLVADPATEAGVLIDLFLSHRALKDWPGMVALHARLPAHLRRTVLVREQLAFAQNRAGDWRGAEQTLLDVIEERGPSSETCGLLGRVYKDRWEAADEAGEARQARGWLRKAIDAYLQGFQADWRDAYPGVNAVTLLELDGSDEARAQQAEVLPVVRYSAQRRLAGSAPDYWDHATLLELAVLASDPGACERHLSDALAAVREPWEPETTARNLRLIAEARAARGEQTGWIDELVAELQRASAPPRTA